MAPTEPASRRFDPPRPTKTLRNRTGRGKGRLTVDIPSKLPAYVPGSGPPLQRIRLLPRQDSTAFIVDRILRPSPGLAANGKPLPKRMAYIVGWTDLPAARVLVPAMEVLEYVSPHALEAWECDMEMQLDEDRKLLAEEQQMAAVEHPDGASRKRPRPPPRHTAIESAVVAEAEMEAQPRPKRPKVGAMSLSTPKKSRLEDFAGLSDDESKSPSRRLETASGWKLGGGGGGSDGKEDVDLGEEAADQTSSSDEPELGWHTPMEGLEENDQARPVVSSQWTPVQLASPFPFDSNFHVSAGPPSRLSSILRLPQKERTQTFTSANGQFISFNASDARSASGGRDESRHTRSTSPAQTDQNGWHTIKVKTESPDSQRRKQDSSTKAAAKMPKVDKNMIVDEGGETAWVVKRVQDAALYNVEGRGLTRYFKVLWEGDWPPDQNPTWEPEENIPEELVRSYFRRSTKRSKAIRQASAKHGRRAAKKGPGLDVGTQYSSVSDAFMGRDFESGADLSGFEDVSDEDRDSRLENSSDQADEMLVVEET
ncbi:hypothetical protein RJ55_06395 [Drechmeria coniospora]|nr:hypothetical protein RJ55_06395 [Drechmeria coniospora]